MSTLRLLRISMVPCATTKRPRAGLALLLVAAAIGTGACGKEDGAAEFREGVPYHEDVALVIPGISTQQGALTATGAAGVTLTRGALVGVGLGAIADSYKLTRDITDMVNGGTVSVLTLLKTITEFPATTVAPDVAVWGPYTGPLDQNTWRLTVNRLGTGMFHYIFEAKPRGTDDTMYLTILSGQHNVATPGAQRRANLPAYGSGNFTLDWDNAQKLPQHDDNVGKAAFTYSRPSPTAPVNIAVMFTQVFDKDTQMRIDAQYDYLATPGQGGDFQFMFTKNSIPTTAALETSSVRSRWEDTGAGRSDIKIVGGDVGAGQATINECWGTGDTGFGSVYLTNSYGDPAKMWGAESACGIASADYATF